MDPSTIFKHNALLNVARTPDISWYSTSWSGPPASSMVPTGQLAALDVFNSGIGLSNQFTSSLRCTLHTFQGRNIIEPSYSLYSTTVTPSSTNTPGTTPSLSSQRSGKTPAVIIAPAIISSMIICLTIATVIITIRRRSQRRSIRTHNLTPGTSGEIEQRSALCSLSNQVLSTS